MTDATRRMLRRIALAAVVLGVLARVAVFRWDDPWGPHHPDEHILPLEAIALWEGVAPREIGWPAAPTRLVLSGAAAVDWLADEGRTTWALRHEPDRALETITTWIGRQYVDPAGLYKLGRLTSVLTGILQIAATVWALSQWVGPMGIAAGTFAVALAPLAVVYSQYVLSDMAGVLFSTLVVGLAARPTPRRIVAAGALSGLGAASKLHFGLWLLTPLACVWLNQDDGPGRKLRLSVSTALVAAWVMVTLVPWLWTNPLLALKEFAGIVGPKIGQGAVLGQIPLNVVALFAGAGVAMWFGAAVGLFTLSREAGIRIAPILLPLALGVLILGTSAIVFDRYGLVLLPGVVVLSAIGWERWYLAGPTRLRSLMLPALTVCVLLSAASTVVTERIAGETDVDVLAKRWILANVPRGQTVAVYDESNALLPRTPASLRECIQRVSGPAAYREKWLVEGLEPAAGGEPMRSMLLNDELHLAYWCSRELAVTHDEGFHVVPYHRDRRFGAILEGDAIDAFTRGAHQDGGIDVLVMNRAIDRGPAPAQTFVTRRGQRVIYRH